MTQALGLILMAAAMSVDPGAARHQSILALIPFEWRDLQYEIAFMAPQNGYRAMTFKQERRIEIYERPGDDVRRIAHDVAHELGHAVDLKYNTPATRKKWMEARGIDPATPWFGCERCSDYNTSSGDFAETFALMLLGPEYFAAHVARPPTPQEVPRLISFFSDFGIKLKAQ